MSEPVGTLTTLRAARPTGRRRGYSRRRAMGNVGAVLVGIVLVLTWQWASGRVLDELWVSKPTAIWTALVQLLTAGDLARHAPTTLYEATAGFVVGAVPGALLGLVLGRNQMLASIARPYLVGFYSTPRLALAPLFIIWFGIDAPMKIYFTATVVFFPVFLTAFTGAAEVPPQMLDTIRLMKAGRLFAYRHVILPSTMVWIIAGFRQSVPHAVTGAVVGELVASNRGLGFLLIQAAGQFNTAKLFAVLFVLIAIALVSYELLGVLEHRLLRWKKSGSGELDALG